MQTLDDITLCSVALDAILSTSTRAGKVKSPCTISAKTLFTLFEIKTFSTWGPSAFTLFKNVSKKLISSLGVSSAGCYLAKHISICEVPVPGTQFPAPYLVVFKVLVCFFNK